MKPFFQVSRRRATAPRGFLMLLALVFGSIFVTVLGALSGFVVVENRVQNENADRSESFTIAEAGLDYYRWHLAHFPNDLQNGTGQPGPYTISYKDPEGGTIGTINLTVKGNTSCNQVTSIDLTSTGIASTTPTISRTVTARYARPTVALYSYILNDSVWAGADRIINGPYHSNGGIRMDGTANAPVTSSLSSWLCTSSFGCQSNTTEPGVFGAGGNQTLWNYPTPQVDFSAIAADFSSLKTAAQSSGIYLPRYSSGSSNNTSYWNGYHLIFNSNGTVTVKRVTSTTSLSTYPVNSADSYTDTGVIHQESTYNTYTIPAGCGLIYVEDNTWVEGTVPNKVTLVVANVVNTGVAPNAYLRGNLNYANTSAGFTLIAENDVLVTPDSPTNMTLNGIFIAQNGAFGRNYYDCYSYPSYSQKGTLTIHGTTVSNKRTGTKWSGGSNCTKNFSSGYETRVDAYDRRLATDPPPFTPYTSTDYRFVDWNEK